MTATLQRARENGATKVVDSRAAFVRRARIRRGVGVVLVIVAVLLGWQRDIAARDRQSVLAVARSVPAGQELTSRDLEVVEVALDGRIAAVPASSLSEVLGKVAATELRPGRLLDAEALLERGRPSEATVFLPLSLEPGQYPPGLEVGDHVVVVVTAPPTSREAVEADRGLPASVIAIDGERGFGVSETVVTVSIPRSDLARLAVASGEGRVMLAMAAP